MIGESTSVADDDAVVSNRSVGDDDRGLRATLGPERAARDRAGGTGAGRGPAPGRGREPGRGAGACVTGASVTGASVTGASVTGACVGGTVVGATVGAGASTLGSGFGSGLGFTTGAFFGLKAGGAGGAGGGGLAAAPGTTNGTTSPRPTEVATVGTASATPTTARKLIDRRPMSTPTMRRRRLRPPLSSTKTGDSSILATSPVTAAAGAGASSAPGRHTVTPSGTAGAEGAAGTLKDTVTSSCRGKPPGPVFCRIFLNSRSVGAQVRPGS